MISVYRKIIFFIAFSILISFGHAYSQQVKWGKIQNSKTSLYSPTIIGDDENSFYSISSEDEKIYIEKFNKSDLSRQYSKLLDRPKIDKRVLDYEGIYFMKSKFVIFASYYNSKESNTQIYAYIYNSDDGKKAGEPKNILTVPVEKQKSKGSFTVFVSNDRSRILVNHVGYYKKEKCWKDRYLLINDNLEAITEREDKIFKNEVDFSTFNYIIDNEGSFYYIKKMNTGESFIVSYDAGKDYEKWEEHIDFSDVNRKTTIVNVRFILNSENDLMLVGYYTLDKKYLEGTFVMKVRTTSKEIVYKKINTFNKDNLKELVASNALKIFVKNNPRVPLDYYNKTELLARGDGGIILIGENSMVVGSAIMLMDMMILTHSPEGELMWAQKVPKYQTYSINTLFTPEKFARIPLDYRSYFPVIQKDQLMIFLNDRRAYASKSKVQMLNDGRIKASNLKKMKKTLPVSYVFDLKTGELKKSEMLSKASGKVYFKPIISYQNKYDKDAVFYSQFKKNYRFGLLTE